MSNEVTIVGSGAAGVAAALRLADLGIRSVIVDVGIEPKRETPITENLYGLRDKADLFDVMIGRNFERIRSLSHRAPRLPAKLTAPRIGFVTQDADRLSPLRQTNFAAVRSFATGGLANAWGGNLYRTTQEDLIGFPVRESALSGYYDRLTKEIGISGEDDDLTRFSGARPGSSAPCAFRERPSGSWPDTSSASPASIAKASSWAGRDWGSCRSLFRAAARAITRTSSSGNPTCPTSTAPR